MFCRQVNKELLAAMEVSTDEIGKVFLELAPYLKFYSTYANDFEKATKLVEEWTEKHKVNTLRIRIQIASWIRIRIRYTDPDPISEVEL